MRKILTEWGGRAIALGIGIGSVCISLFVITALARLFCEVGKYAWQWGGLL